MNIHYIRAAILHNTGVKLTLPQTRDILIEEGLVTPIQASRMIFSGYDEYYKGDNITPINEDEEVKELLIDIPDEVELVFTDDEPEIIDLNVLL